MDSIYAHLILPIYRDTIMRKNMLYNNAGIGDYGWRQGLPGGIMHHIPGGPGAWGDGY